MLACALRAKRPNPPPGSGVSPVQRLERAAERAEQRRPVGTAVRIDLERDVRPVERDVGDLDAAEKQREEMQMRDQPLGGERRRLAALIAEHDVREGDDAGRKYR